MRWSVIPLAIMAASSVYAGETEAMNRFIQRGYQRAAEVQQAENQEIDSTLIEIKSLLELITRGSKINKRSDANYIVHGDDRFTKISTTDDLKSLNREAVFNTAASIVFPSPAEKNRFTDHFTSLLEQSELKKNTRPLWIPPAMDIRNRMDSVGYVHHRFRVFQNLDDGTFLATYAMRELSNLPMVLISGMENTEKLADETEVLIDGYAMCVRTYKYDTTAGATKTVEVLDLFDKSKIEEVIRKNVPDEDRKMRVNQPKPKTYESRTWKDATGKFAIEAKFKKLSGDSVTIEKQDGTEITILLSKLSSKDRLWVNENAK